MKILARVHLFPPEHCAGAERMLEALLVALHDAGHEIEVHLARGFNRPPYLHRGLNVFPRGTSDWLASALDADVLITHLDQTSEVVGIAAVLDKPIVQVLHNTHPPTKMWASCKADLLVYNSEWMAAEMGYDPHAIICRPPVFAHDYAVDRPGAMYTTLINTQAAKGGLMFSMLAALNPRELFLGVGGAYGEQLNPHLANTIFVEHAAAEMTSIYRHTKVLLMPSTYESWGRVGVEAMASGIPVIANPTPGLRESLGEAGIFCDLSDLDDWNETLATLLGDPVAYAEASEAALKRSAELDPTTDLANFVKAVEAL